MDVENLQRRSFPSRKWHGSAKILADFHKKSFCVSQVSSLIYDSNDKFHAIYYGFDKPHFTIPLTQKDSLGFIVFIH